MFSSDSVQAIGYYILWLRNTMRFAINKNVFHLKTTRYDPINNYNNMTVLLRVISLQEKQYLVFHQ